MIDDRQVRIALPDDLAIPRLGAPAPANEAMVNAHASALAGFEHEPQVVSSTPPCAPCW